MSMHCVHDVVTWKVIPCSHCNFVLYCSGALMSRSIIVHFVKDKLFRLFGVKHFHHLPTACEPKLCAVQLNSPGPSKEYIYISEY